MIKIIITFLIIAGAFSQSPAALSPENQALINGFMEGSTLNSLIPDLTGCGGDTTKIVDSIGRAVEFFKRSPLAIEDIEGGVMQIGLAVEAIGTTAKKCSAIPTNFLKIYNYAVSLIHNSSAYG